MNKSYSKAYKKEILMQYANGESVMNIHNNTGISRSTLYSWIKKEKAMITDKEKLNLRDYHDIKSKCDRQEKIIEILKRSPCCVSAPLRERYKVIESLKSEYSETLLCDALNVSKGSYYNHIFRSKKDCQKYIERENTLKPVIEEIYINSNYTYGPARVKAVMKEKGYTVSERVVARIMHENEWFAIRTSSKKLYEINQKRKNNVLKQQLNVSKPNEVWVSDITIYKFNGKAFYICAIMDLYARKIIAYKISDRNTSRLTINTFKKAYAERQPNPAELLFHSDNGANYTSRSFTELLQKLGIRQSFSRPGIPYDNSVMESFFKTLKAEELYIGRYRSENDFKQSIEKYIYYYNSQRHHSMLRYTTPDKFEEKYWQKSGNKA